MQQNNEQNIVNLEHLTFNRGKRKIFNDVSFSFQRGKVTAILGPSGTGKTTLLHLMGGLLSPDRGSLQVLGQEVPMLSTKRLFSLRKRMGMLFQSGALFTDLTVFDNVAFPIRQHTRLPDRLIHDIVLMKLEAVGLRGAKNLMPAELSGGMAHRVALARAIALDPEIMLYDEPFTGQDPISMGVLVKLIRTLNDSLKLTSIIVSHDVNEVLSIADYVYIISGGKVIGRGTPEEILNEQDERVYQFVHGLPDGPVPFHYPAKSLSQDFIEG
ncbi:MAG: ATP-binding cassette domain-containing protein [Gammaproteobacteria bacterium]|nr:ATP-binding cassette domain-containing protein [Gammaproteobacteria bacterium]